MGKIKMPSLFRRKSRSSSPPPAHNQEEQAASKPSGSPTRTAEEEMVRVFRKFDANGDGRISRPELSVLFESLGHAATDDELSRMMAEADADGDGFIDLVEQVTAAAAAAAAGEQTPLRSAEQGVYADLTAPSGWTKKFKELSSEAQMAPKGFSAYAIKKLQEQEVEEMV